MIAFCHTPPSPQSSFPFFFFFIFSINGIALLLMFFRSFFGDFISIFRFSIAGAAFSFNGKRLARFTTTIISVVRLMKTRFALRFGDSRVIMSTMASWKLSEAFTEEENVKCSDIYSYQSLRFFQFTCFLRDIYIFIFLFFDKRIFICLFGRNKSWYFLLKCYIVFFFVWLKHYIIYIWKTCIYQLLNYLHVWLWFHF